MDHRRIEEMNIPDLYVTGRLTTEDEEAFESHLLACRECREQVAWADDFGVAMRGVAVEEAARTAARAGLLVWLARRGPAVRMAMTAALLALAALPAWLVAERSSLQEELTRARAAAARPAPPAPQPSPVPQSPDPAMQAKLNQLQQEASRLAAELGREREIHASLGEQIDALKQPQANTYTASLGVVRGSDDLGEVLLGSRPEFILLSVGLPDDTIRPYRATIQDAGGRTVWQGSDLTPTPRATLDILVHSDLLKPGEYRMSLEVTEKGRTVPAGEIGFLARREG
ncbi:MAG: zf-HC2 domain-containing protein [Acidobacteriota bacterium]